VVQVTRYVLIARYPGAYKAGDSIKEAYKSYRLVGPYDTFEDYCKDVEGLAYSTAKEKIQAYLVHVAIEENLGANKLAPSMETQVRQFFAHEGSIAKFKTEKRIVQKRDGTNAIRSAKGGTVGDAIKQALDQPPLPKNGEIGNGRSSNNVKATKGGNDTCTEGYCTLFGLLTRVFQGFQQG
jgi:hypothetical protein